MKPFLTGPEDVKSILNEMQAMLRSHELISGGEYLRISKNHMGTAIMLDIEQIQAAMPNSGGDGGGATHKAYVKTVPGAVTTISCYLDSNTSGSEGAVINVNCSVIGGGKLNAAAPRTIIGSLIFVEQIGEDWWATHPFIATENCDCYEEPA